ncbi:MAG: T9SS type A sorting domain-containing protein [Bacteroidetes bacterium]|nr:T9SS type A sorting domain-containing protein [Bacteroidota bacterium]
MACHSKEEIHGDDGVAYPSLKAAGAIKKECSTCHANVPANSAHSVHADKVDCAACHAEAVLTCSSCHFESLLATGKNRAINQLRNYRLLVKKDGKVRLGGFMTHTYDGKTNYIISSYHSHIIKKEAIGCAECHHNMGGTNAAIDEYNSTGFISMTKWNESTKKIAGPSGVVPIPADWKRALVMDYAHYTGDPAVVTSDPTKWEYLKSTTDNSHLFYCEPLDESTMTKLGFTRTPNSLPVSLAPAVFTLEQNVPNPVVENTRISFELDRGVSVQLTVYNSLGQEVARPLQDVSYHAGRHTIRFDAAGLQNGLYYYTLASGTQRATRKMIVMR